MKHFNGWLLLSVIIFTATVTPARADVLFLGSIQGETRECHCGGGPAGGLARIKTVVEEYRRNYTGIIVAGRGEQYGFQPDTIRDRTISKVISALKYDAVGLGATDLINGSGWLKRNIGSCGIKYVNCNILYRNAPIAQLYRIVADNGRRVGFTSALSPKYLKTPVLKGKLSAIKVLPAVKELQKVLTALSQQADEMVVISHLTVEDESALLKWYKSPKPLLLLTGRVFGGRDTSYAMKNVTVVKLGGLGRHAAFVKNEPSGRNEPGKCFRLGDVYKPNEMLAKQLEEDFPLKEPEALNLPKTLATRVKGAESMVFYYAPDCPDCRQVIKDSLVVWKERAGINVEMVDISVPANYFRLMEDEKRAGTPTTEMPVVLYRNMIYSGKDNIFKKLCKSFR